MKELILAVRLERELTKAEILSIYLNHVYLGHGAYGVGAAAETYFGKEVEDLTIAEAAMLAGLVASPTQVRAAPQHGRSRASASATCSATCATTSTSPTPSTRPRSPSRSRSSTRATSTTSRRRTSSSTSASSRRSATATAICSAAACKFYSTLDTRMQAAAEGALRKGLESLDRKLGFRGPIGAVALAQRGAWTGGPAHPMTGATDDTSALADQLLPEQTYGAMVVELPRSGVGVTVDLGPKRLPLVDADARDVRAWRDAKTGTTAPSQARRPAAGAARPPTARRSRSRSARRCRAR